MADRFFPSHFWLSHVPAWVFVLLAFGVSAALLAGLFRSQLAGASRPVRTGITGLRVAVVALLLVCALRPAVPRENVEVAGQRPGLFLFLDASGSTSLADRGMGPVTRFNLLQNAARRLAQQNPGYDAQIIPFHDVLPAVPADPEGEDAEAPSATSGTDLTLPLQYLAALSPVRGSQAVILSDGRHTAAMDLAAATAAYSAIALVPIHTIGLSGERRSARFAITRVRAPQFAWMNRTMDVVVDLELAALGDRTFQLQLQRDRVVVATRAVDAVPGSQQIRFALTPVQEGEQTYTVALRAADAEAPHPWSSIAFRTRVAARDIRVLYLEGTVESPQLRQPGYVTLRDALNQAPDISCDVMVDPDYRRGIRKPKLPMVNDPGKGFPRTVEGLAQYDVIINSDIRRPRFSAAQIENTATYVEKLGGGFVMIGGYTAYGSGGWDETLIDRIIPVDMAGDYYEDPFQWIPTPAGRAHPIFQLDPDPERNDAILDAVPTFYGRNHAWRVKPGALLLARSSQSVAIPVLAVQDVGRGRAMAFLSDTTWGWGRDFERSWGEPITGPTDSRDNRYYRTFWQNAVRWLAHNSPRATYGHRFITTDRLSYEPGEVARVQYHDAGAFLLPTPPDVVLSVRDDAGEERAFACTARPERGVFEAAVPVRTTADLGLAATRSDEPESAVELRLDNRPLVGEYLASDPDTNALTGISEAGFGLTALVGQDLDLPPPRIGDRGREVRFEDYHEVWDRAWLLVLAVGLLTVEWLIRRTAGLA